MKASVRKILTAAWYILLLLVFVFIYITVYLASKNSVKPSSEDADLIFVRPDVPVQSNAYYTLLKATNEIYWPENIERRLEDLSVNTNWDDSLAADILDGNQSSLNSFNEAMQQPFLLVPEIKTMDDDLSYLSGWRRLCKLESIQIFSLHRAKKDKEAFDRTFEIIQFGQRAENCGAPTLHYLVGSSIKSVGLWDIRQIVADTTLTEADLQTSIRKLNEFAFNKEGFTNTLKAEYKIESGLLDDYANGKISDTTNSEFGRVMTSIAMKPFLNVQETKNEFVKEDREFLNNLSRPYAKFTFYTPPGLATNASTLRRLASGNVMGDIFYDMFDYSSQSLAKRKSSEEVNVTATQILVALKIYKMQHGKLPDSLPELVPEILPQVPIDDFDGMPFRYSPEKKIIYSVGPCLKDLGGIEKTDHYSTNYNLPFKIEF